MYENTLLFLADIKFSAVSEKTLLRKGCGGNCAF